LRIKKIFSPSDKSIVNMEVRQSGVNQIVRTNLTIPYEEHETKAYIQINDNLKVNPRNKFCIGKIMFPSDYLSGQRNTNETYDLIIAEKITLQMNIVDISDGSGEESISLSIPIGKDSGNFECQVWENGFWSSNICTTSSIQHGYVNCRCKKISSFRAAEITDTEMDLSTTTVAALVATTEQILNITETVTSAPVQNSTDVTDTTVESLTTIANTVLTSLVQTTINESTTATTTTMSSVTYNENLPTLSTNATSILGNSSIQANAVATTASDLIEIVTLTTADITPTLITKLASTSANNVSSVTTELVQNTTLSSSPDLVTTSNYTESIFSTIVSSVNSNNSALHKEVSASTDKAAYSSATGYTLAMIFVIAGIFIVVGVFFYSRRKKPNSLAQQLEIISSEIRTSNNAVKYARFHDEDTMRGDNIETIFTAQ
ncbi:hypothetical protein Bhyg_11331, partial [Pseudolycoriella hygida]